MTYLGKRNRESRIYPDAWFFLIRKLLLQWSKPCAIILVNIYWSKTMAYSELVKNFNRIREYMREFYVYGFKSRDEYTNKSSRTYDDEKRRMESILGDYMQFRTSAEGKNVFLSIDSRISEHNPLYKAWKTKSFTDGDITLHFIVMDIFKEAEGALTMNEIMENIDDYLCEFENPRTYDESTVRKKLKEYVSIGLLLTKKEGRTVLYELADDADVYDADILNFFSEIMPVGVIGSFILDKDEEQEQIFRFKHHYITGSLDSEIMCDLFMAIRDKKECTIELINRNGDNIGKKEVVPLKVLISAATGRQYVLVYIEDIKRIQTYRLDSIVSVKIGKVVENFEEYKSKLDGMLPNMWGVSTQSFDGNRMEHVEFTIKFEDDEEYIFNRLEREKRCGNVERIDNNTAKFSCDVFDSSELVPWIRTFICRITDIKFSNRNIEKRFLKDLEWMYEQYDI